MSICDRCSRPLAADAGRTLPAHRDRLTGTARPEQHVCMVCYRAYEAERQLRRDQEPPSSHIDPHTRRRVYHIQRALWENPGGWLNMYGLAGNAWAAWAAQHGLLDELFEREVTLDDFGDMESVKIAELLPRRVNQGRGIA